MGHSWMGAAQLQNSGMGLLSGWVHSWMSAQPAAVGRTQHGGNIQGEATQGDFSCPQQLSWMHKHPKPGKKSSWQRRSLPASIVNAITGSTQMEGRNQAARRSREAKPSHCTRPLCQRLIQLVSNKQR